MFSTVCLMGIFFVGLKPANIIFLVDGTNQNHFDVIQKTVYNLHRLFARTSTVAFFTFGGALDSRFASWKVYEGVSVLVSAANALRYVNKFIFVHQWRSWLSSSAA